MADSQPHDEPILGEGLRLSLYGSWAFAVFVLDQLSDKDHKFVPPGQFWGELRRQPEQALTRAEEVYGALDQLLSRSMERYLHDQRYLFRATLDDAQADLRQWQQRSEAASGSAD